MTVAQRQNAEKQVVGKLLDEALKNNLTFRLHDGEAWATEKTTDKDIILNAIMSVDDETLYFYTADGERSGWVRLIYGNDGWDVLADNSQKIDYILPPVTQFANELCEKLFAA